MNITEQDFEYLTDNSMKWVKRDWAKQIFRFEGGLPEKGFIFWVENYASLMLCRQFCEERGFEFYPSFDTAVTQWCFVTNYAAHWEEVNV